MPLTNLQAKNAEPKDKTYRLYDSAGMYLEITPRGGKYWRLKYRIDGKEKRLALGVYPMVSLSEARQKRDAARYQIAENIDPLFQRKIKKAAGIERSQNTFEVVAKEWIDKQSNKWSKSYSTKILSRLNCWLFPAFGPRPIAEISAPELLSLFRKAEAKGALDTAHRLRQITSEIFRYGIATMRCNRDISVDLRGALIPSIVRHMPAIINPKDLALLLRSIDSYIGWGVVRTALRLAPLVFVRPGELRAARWSDINFDECLWSYTITKTKTAQAHIVPLSRQAMALLMEIKPLTGEGEYVFPSPRGGRPMSENALRAALIAIGYGETQTAHGFRATARTLLDEILEYPPHIIEQQLGHTVKDAQGRAYNRTAHLAQRKEMMQAWADYLDSLKETRQVNVIS